MRSSHYLRVGSFEICGFSAFISPKKNSLEIEPPFLAGCVLVWWLGGYWGCECRGEGSLACSSGASGVVMNTVAYVSNPPPPIT